eukprot:c28503_g1_i1 orf=565-3126(+)
MMRPEATVKPAKNTHTFLDVICRKKNAQSSSHDSLNIQRKTKSPSSFPDNAPSLASNIDASEKAILPITSGNPPAKQFSDLVIVGKLEVQVLECPTRDELKQKLELLEPEIVYFHGQESPGTNEIGPLELSDCQISTPDIMTSLFGCKMPELVYLETSAGGKLGEALYSKGVPYVIFWRGLITYPLVVYFRQALIAGLQSSAIEIWSAFQLANASFKLHCGQLKIQGAAQGQQRDSSTGPAILGEPPSNLIEPPKAVDSEEEDSSPTSSPAIKIYDNETELPFLVCTEPYSLDNSSVSALEDGLNALLTLEVKCMRLLHRVSAPPPVAAVPSVARGVVTMRCDLFTLSFARVSLLVSGSAHTCFDDLMLEYSIKKELLQRDHLVSSVTVGGDKAVPTAELRRSASIAFGAPVVEIRFRTSTWLSQVLRQLALESSYRCLVALGVAGVQGFPVAAFQKEDAELLFSLWPDLSRRLAVSTYSQFRTGSFYQVPSWLASPLPSRKKCKMQSPGSLPLNDRLEYSEDARSPLKSNGGDTVQVECMPLRKYSPAASSSSMGLTLVAAMKPVPHTKQNRQMPFAGAVSSGAQNSWSMKVSLPNGPNGKAVRPNNGVSHPATVPGSGVAGTHSRQLIRAPSPAQMLVLKSMPIKKHGCRRRPIHDCSEEELLKDVMQFLISRGHSRLVPSSGIESFPDAILNGKRLDLYNLYKEVASRGGFHVGNGINWKGQVFSKMRNHTMVNKMTGVGNTLKKHYETYLLEYELAHDDVDGECCILCHSSAAGDWVNCGICGEWAHFGCDKRNGLGAFKDYAKTDGLEYICPRCSAANGRGPTGRKKHRNAMGSYPQTLESLAKGQSM